MSLVTRLIYIYSSYIDRTADGTYKLTCQVPPKPRRTLTETLEILCRQPHRSSLAESPDPRSLGFRALGFWDLGF